MPRRKSLRLKGYDYTSDGWYFITVCTHQRESYITQYVQSKQIIHQVWLDLPIRFSNLQIDEFIVMPDHIHGIIKIKNVGAGFSGPISNDAMINDGIMEGGRTPPLRVTLGQIVAYLKYQTTKRIHDICKIPHMKFWQRNYYERIIRNEKELNVIRQYIKDNPSFLDEYHENPRNL